MGVLVACFAAGDTSRYCFIQVFEPMDSLGTTMLNEYECPLYSLTNLFRCVPSDCIKHSVSLLHECTPSCTFKQANAESQIERENVVNQQLVFEHDYNSNIYSLNIYCMNHIE